MSDARKQQQPYGAHGREHTFTIDTGESQSIIRPDVVKGKCETLSNVKLRTANGKSATVHGKTEAKVSVSDAFIVYNSS